MLFDRTLLIDRQATNTHSFASSRSSSLFGSLSLSLSIHEKSVRNSKTMNISCFRINVHIQHLLDAKNGTTRQQHHQTRTDSEKQHIHQKVILSNLSLKLFTHNTHTYKYQHIHTIDTATPKQLCVPLKSFPFEPNKKLLRTFRNAIRIHRKQKKEEEEVPKRERNRKKKELQFPTLQYIHFLLIVS